MTDRTACVNVNPEASWKNSDVDDQVDQGPLWPKS